VADGESLPFGTGAFDRVTCIGSLEHFQDPLRGAAEMARLLRGDGLAVIHVPNSFGLRWNVLHAWRHGDVCDDGQPLQRYGTRRQWERLLAAAGLDVRQVVGYEGEIEGWRDWLGVARHPSRLLIPLGGRLPVDMASILIFLCRKA
jgi:SAM-dependent methyltransferase